MRLWKIIIFFFPVLHIHHIDHGPTVYDLLHGHGHVHGNVLVPQHDRLLTGHLKLDQKMAELYSSIIGRHIEPGDTLSNLDLVKILSHDTLEKVEEVRKDTKEDLDLDREHNREVIKHVVEGLCKRIDSLENFVLKLSSDLNNRLADLEIRARQLINQENMSLEEKINNLELKFDTTSVYLEQVIHTSRADTFHALSTLSKDRPKCQCLSCDTSSQIIACNKCHKTFPDPSKLETHTCGSGVSDTSLESTIVSSQAEDMLNQHHLSVSLQPCKVCGMVFTSTSDLSFHIERHHVSRQVHPCFPCGETSPRIENLQTHASYIHEDRDGPFHHLNNDHTQDNPNKCYICDNMFPSHGHLQAHTIAEHNTSILSDYQLSYRNQETRQQPQIHCVVCEQVFFDMRDLNIHTSEHHSLGALVTDPDPSS